MGNLVLNQTGTPDGSVSGANGAAFCAEQAMLAGEGPNLPLSVESRYAYQNITTAVTTTVKGAPGFLRSLIFNGGATGGTITVYDNTAASGTIIATIVVAANALLTVPFDCEFYTGLTIVTSAATNITAIYR